jgi:Fe2+ transport system protein FeoA
MTCVPLSDIRKQHSGQILRLRGSRALRQRLAAIGILKGQPVALKAATLWGGPRVYIIGQHQYCLRHEEASQIDVQLTEIADCA